MKKYYIDAAMKRLNVNSFCFFLFSFLLLAVPDIAQAQFGRLQQGGNNRWAVGGGLVLDVSDTGTEARPSAQVGGGPMMSAEAAYTSSFLGSYAILDARVFAAISAGAQIPGIDGNTTAFFSLRLMGSATFGTQVFKVIPLTLSVEDVNLVVDSSGSRSQALIGTTVFIPFNILENMDPHSTFYLAVTAGSRHNSLATHDAAGIQPKIRFLSEHYSLELRGVISFSSDVHEQTGVVQFARNSVFSRRDSIGIYLRASNLEDPNPAVDARSGEGFVFYGGQF